MNKMLRRMQVAERLRRENERAAAAEQQRAEVTRAHIEGRAAGRREAEATRVALPQRFADEVLARAAREFGSVLARKMLEQNVPGQVTTEVAKEVWSMMQSGSIRALGVRGDAHSYVRWRVEERGDLRIDFRVPEMHWSYSVDRLDLQMHTDRFRA